jgi:hypothetical protein
MGHLSFIPIPTVRLQTENAALDSQSECVSFGAQTRISGTDFAINSISLRDLGLYWAWFEPGAVGDIVCHRVGNLIHFPKGISVKTKAVLVGVMMMVLQACNGSSSSGSGVGGDSGANNPAVKEAADKCANTPIEPGDDLRYVMSETVNGTSCTTGCQIFHSVGAYCDALQDDSLNNNCAKTGREELYQENCR